MTVPKLAVIETASELPGRAVPHDRLLAVLDALDRADVPTGVWAKVFDGPGPGARAEATRIVSTLQKNAYRSEIEVALRGNAVWVRRPEPVVEAPAADPGPAPAVETTVTIDWGTPWLTPDPLETDEHDQAPDDDDLEAPGSAEPDGMRTEAEDLEDFVDAFRSTPGDLFARTRAASKLMGIPYERAIRLRTAAGKAGLLRGVREAAS